MTFDDDTLIAYLDGQLPETGYGPLEQALKDDAALRTRLQALAESSELARRAFDPVLLEPVPPQLIAAIWQAPDPRARAASPKSNSPRVQGMTGWTTPLRPWLGWGTGRRAWSALASVVVLGLGAVIGWQWLAPSDDTHWALRQGETVANQSLALALDVSPSGRVLRTAGGSVELLASFEQAGGGHCREFNRNSPDGRRDELGIACRTAEGAWQLDFLAAEQRPADRGAGGYQTASDRQHGAADAFLSARVQGPALDEAEEKALIERGWAPP